MARTAAKRAIKKGLALKGDLLALAAPPVLPEPVKMPWGDDKNLEEIADALEFRCTQCCGISEASGMNSLKNVEDVLALRRVTGHNGVDDELEDGYGYNKYHATDENGDLLQTNLVLVTTTQDQERAAKLLAEGGFEKLCKFTNDNTQNLVTLWGALTL